MSVKRLRIFAGPNGSGKTTIVKRLQSEIPFGVYVNADDIEKSLIEGKMLIFDTYQIKVDQIDISDFFRTVAFSPQKRNEPDLAEKLFVKNNVLSLKCNADSYLAADVAEFIRQKLLQSGISFSFETVMSHKSKLDFLEKARQLGYRIYLYFIATKDTEINISRVNVRVAQKGHPVPADLIESRYYRSLSNLKSAIKLSHRAYLWDNSGRAALLFAEITNGKEVNIIDKESVPKWFFDNVMRP